MAHGRSENNLYGPLLLFAGGARRLAAVGLAQKAASGRSISSVVVDSTISRSAASRGSTVSAKNRAAAILPWENAVSAPDAVPLSLARPAISHCRTISQ